MSAERDRILLPEQLFVVNPDLDNPLDPDTLLLITDRAKAVIDALRHQEGSLHEPTYTLLRTIEGCILQIEALAEAASPNG
jgi:hypothetical protein